MRKRYSVTEAREQLPDIVHEVRQNGPVELTHGGQPVVVLLSLEQFQQLEPRKRDFGAALMRWREKIEREGIDIPLDTFEGIRDKSPGRDAQL
jgi:prevent-host-death family protein